jgi:hypothetical protein
LIIYEAVSVMDLPRLGQVHTVHDEHKLFVRCPGSATCNDIVMAHFTRTRPGLASLQAVSRKFELVP